MAHDKDNDQAANPGSSSTPSDVDRRLGQQSVPFPGEIWECAATGDCDSEVIVDYSSPQFQVTPNGFVADVRLLGVTELRSFQGELASQGYRPDVPLSREMPIPVLTKDRRTVQAKVVREKSFDVLSIHTRSRIRFKGRLGPNAGAAKRRLLALFDESGEGDSK